MVAFLNSRLGPYFMTAVVESALSQLALAMPILLPEEGCPDAPTYFCLVAGHGGMALHGPALSPYDLAGCLPEDFPLDQENAAHSGVVVILVAREGDTAYHSVVHIVSP